MKKILFLALLLGISNFAVAKSVHMPNFYAYSSKCPKDKPFLNKHFENAQCIGCDYLGEIEVEPGHEKDFSICSNRKMYDGRSILKECPSGTFKELMANKNIIKCIPCTEEFFVLSTKDDCMKCPNRMWNKSSTQSNLDMGFCALKGK